MCNYTTCVIVLNLGFGEGRQEFEEGFIQTPHKDPTVLSGPCGVSWPSNPRCYKHSKDRSFKTGLSVVPEERESSLGKDNVEFSRHSL